MTTGTSLTSRPAFKALQAHYQQMKGAHLRELFAQDARRGERYEVARHDHAGIPIRTAFVNRRLTVHHGDAVTFARGIVCRAQTNHAAADDEDRFG